MKDKVKLGIKIVFLVFIIAWMGILIRDYSKKEFDALSENERNEMLYTYQCTGLGYKFFRYKREFNAIEFGPFFTKERQSVND